MTDSSSSGTRSQSNRGGSVSVDSAGATEDQPGPGEAVSASPAELLASAAKALPAGVRQAHDAAVAAIQQAYAAVPPGAKVRLAKRTSNLFRFRDQSPGSRAGELDVSAFSRVLHVDPASRTAVVGGMTTYEDLADATLAHGLMPFVVPQLKTITLGGAVTGLGIESTSLRLGMPHESVLALEILTGDGQVVTATADNEHAGPVPWLPELLRHAGLRAVAHDRAGAGGAVRAPAALPLRRPRELHGGRRADRGRRQPPGAPGRLPGRHHVQPGRDLPHRGGVQRRGPLDQRLHRQARSSTSRCAGRGKTSSPSATTYGAGIPTGSGAPGPSGCRTRRSAGSGHAATGGRMCTARWSPLTGGTASPAGSPSAAGSRRVRMSSRTSRSPSATAPSSSGSSPPTSA